MPTCKLSTNKFLRKCLLLALWLGQTNQPFANIQIRDAFDELGSLHVPKSISLAGAILAVSIKWVHPKLFRSTAPSQVYGWPSHLSMPQPNNLCRKAGNDARVITKALVGVYANSNDQPIGQTFPEWIEEHYESIKCVVLGQGMAGTATAYANAKAGVQTLLVKQGGTLAPKAGSSNGDSHMYHQIMYRQMYSEAIPWPQG